MKGPIVPNPKLAFALMLGAAVIGGCDGSSQSQECITALSVDLDISSEVTIDIDGVDLVINEVLWTITGNGMEPMMGTIDTSDPNSTASVEVFGIPPGEDYLIELEATSEDGETTCRGQAFFDVTVGVATEVGVLLRCSMGQRFGAVRADGWFNVCAELTKAVVAPLETSIGNSIIVSSQAEDHDEDPIEYRWSASTGAFANPNAANTFYTCETLGTHELTISVSDDNFDYCIDSWTVEVTCVQGGGTGGTAGGGTGGAAGGGTGGAAGGGTGGAAGGGTGGAAGGGTGGAAGGGTGGAAGGGTGGAAGGGTGGAAGGGTGGAAGGGTGGAAGGGTGGAAGGGTGGAAGGGTGGAAGGGTGGAAGGGTGGAAGGGTGGAAGGGTGGAGGSGNSSGTGGTGNSSGAGGSDNPDCEIVIEVE